MTTPLERKAELVPYGTLGVDDIGKLALAIGADVFRSLVKHGATHEPPDLHMRAAMDIRPADSEPDNGDRPTMTQIDEDAVGDGGQYAPNTSLQSGKLYTVDKYSADSDETIFTLNLQYSSTDPTTWIGSAFDRARVVLDGVMYDIRVGAACSGIEGWLDRVVSKAIAATIAGAVVLDLQARHKNGTLEQAPYYRLAA